MLGTCRISAGPPLTRYVVVRDDLPDGFREAQIAHACDESQPPGGVPRGTNAIILAVPDEEALAALHQRLRLAGVACAAIFEPDPPWLGQMTALGLVGDKAVLRRHLSSIPLLGGPGASPVTRRAAARRCLAVEG